MLLTKKASSSQAKNRHFQHLIHLNHIVILWPMPLVIKSVTVLCCMVRSHTFCWKTKPILALFMITNAMQLSPLSAAHAFSASQKIPSTNLLKVQGLALTLCLHAGFFHGEELLAPPPPPTGKPFFSWLQLVIQYIHTYPCILSHLVGMYLNICLSVITWKYVCAVSMQWCALHPGTAPLHQAIYQ